jgi:hypothetical protein
MFLKKLRVIFSLCAVLSSVIAAAQTFPASLITSFQNSRTLFLDEYADQFKPRIRTTIYFTDFTESGWQFSLRLKITGPNGIVISTRAGVKPVHPLIVAPGQPYKIEGADLAFYFNYDNLNFSGISRAQLEINHRLPEGLYTFCFEAVDFESNRALSHPACATAYLSLNDPAIIISPVNASVVENTALQNILFQWQVSNATGNLDITKLNYQIDLYEVNNSWTNPTTAIINNQVLPIWQSNLVNKNNYLFTAGDPPLERGKRYVFTVRTTESSGRSSFKNNGYSSPCYFHFGYTENDTIDLVTPPDDFQFTLSTPSEFKWKKPRRALQGQMITYTIKLVEVAANEDPENSIINNLPFFQQTYLASNNALMDKTIPVTIWGNIKRMGKYAWQVKAQSGTQEVAKSPVQTFIGPPDIENFIAGGFLMTVTKLTKFDKSKNIISGECNTIIHPGSTAKPVNFKFENITIAGIGNNEWVMISGQIADAVSSAAYTLQPKDIPENKDAFFLPDSIFVNTTGLKLSGRLEWFFSHPGSSGQLQKIVSNRCKMTLANSTFYLNNNDAINPKQEYDVPLMEPFGFRVKLSVSSVFTVYQSKYEMSLEGLVQLPQNVLTPNSTQAHVVFNDTRQLFYIPVTDGLSSESIQLAQNAKFLLSPRKYVIDLSEKLSPGEFTADSTWKGLYVEEAAIDLPSTLESAQFSLPPGESFITINTTSDTNRIYVTNRGLFLTSAVTFSLGDSIKFNGFASKAGFFYAKLEESRIINSFVRGGILIPVMDTINSFPYNIPLTDYGLAEGYLVNGLANHTFTFNASGSSEQRVVITVKRAVFKNNNRLEMELNLTWPYFQLQLIGVDKFCVWGNNNIGFDVPNGKTPLVYQANGKAGNFDITVDYLGCGRNGNAYALGASAKIAMDEEISGETGAPIVNVYSIYKNPLLTGMVLIPVTGTTSAGSSSVTNNTYQSGTSGYTQALGNDLGDVFGGMGVIVNPLSDSITVPTAAGNADPLIRNNLITDLGRIVDVIYKLKPFIQEVTDISEEDWVALDVLKLVLNHDVAKKSESLNAKELMNYVLGLVLNETVNRINQPIQKVSDKAVLKIRAAINNQIIIPVNGKTDETFANIFGKLQSQLTGQVEEKYHAAIITALASVSNNVSAGIKNSVSASFENNITSKITGLIQVGVTAKIRSFVRKEVTATGLKLISENINAKISFADMVQNAGTLFADVADTISHAIMNASSSNLRNTAESLVEDAISGIDWNAISNQILNELLVNGVSGAIANQLAGTVGQNAGPYAAALLSSVKFDFNNLGEKLQNGQFDQIVKFDPTNIYIESPAINIRGTVRFTKNDPVYGDSWQANVYAVVKVPKKDNPIECGAFFLNGKTTQLPENFSYWFVKLDVRGLNIPLNPAPVIWDGAEGFAFSKMKKTDTTTVVPDITNKFGVGCRFFFYDQQSTGKTYIFDLGADAVFNNGGFAIQLSGNASVLNYQKQDGKYKSPGFVTGTGVLGYYKTSEVTKVAGNFNVTLNTSPLICAGGDVGLDLKSPDNWKVWVGTQQTPIGVKVLCKDFLSNTAYMEVSNSGFQAGLGMNVNISARSPWVQFTGIKVRGFANLAFGYNAYASVEWDPTFKINEASVSAWLSAAIGVDYETAAVANSLTLAGVSMSGSLTYKSNPESEIHGQMSGSITIIGFNVGLDLPVHYSLSKQEIIN